MEITVPELIRPLFDKYKGCRGKLFVFSSRFSDEDGFSKNVNNGLKQICEELKLINDKNESSRAKDKEPVLKRPITTYTFRHTWAAIAQNNCKAKTEEVAFAFCHASAHKVTEGYIRKDYSPIDVLNNKIIDYVLNTEK
jgi:integrase